MEVYMQTDIGRVRDTNEDAVGLFYNDAEQLLAIVADGMGGHQAGEVASNLAVSFVKKRWENTDKLLTKNDSENWLLQCIDELNAYILKKSQENKNYKGMGTTIIMALCIDDSISITHVGDSRCYFLENGKISLKTYDHSYVFELVKNGEITLNEAENHPKKNVLLKVMGTEQVVEPSIASYNRQLINSILLCSDGLTNKITDEELEKVLIEVELVKNKANNLIDLANERGGEDNISIIIIQNALNKVGDKQ